MKPQATAPRATGYNGSGEANTRLSQRSKRDSLGLVFPEPGSIIWGASGAVKNRSKF